MLATLIITGFSLTNYIYLKNRMISDIEQVSQKTSTRLSKYLEKPLWVMDNRQIDDLILSEMNEEKRIFAVVIREIDGKKIIWGKKRDSNWKIIEAKKEPQGKHIINKKAIHFKKRKIGFIEVYTSFKFMTEEMNRSIINIVFYVIGVNILLFLAIFLILKKSIIQPIIKLTDVAERMSTGELDVSITSKSEDEIGDLCNALERLRISLKISLRRIKKSG